MRLATFLLALSLLSPAPAAERPNVIYVLCDDLGYGDLKCLNPEGKIATPNFDKLAAAGMAFTDMHSGSAVCTPTRYGILTGRYAWRTRLQQGVLGGLSPRLIEPGRLTVASLFQQNGYHTAAIGKWHLGMDWVKQLGKEVTELNIETPEQVWNVDYQKPIAGGPTSVGFNDYFGISASLDMVPYTFIENDRVTIVPTVDKSFPLMAGRTMGGMTRLGPATPNFEVEDVLPALTKKAIDYIGQRAAEAKSGKPFFLYLPLASPHTPIAPTSPWKDKSGLNYYADFVMQTDAALGELLAALDQHRLTENTLLIVTSDNGCSPQAKFEELVPKGHNPSYIFRGHKADIYEGGHRIPFLIRWPGHVRPGKQALPFCLTDFLATAADMLDVKLPDNAGEDSVSFLPTLLGTARGSVHEAIVHHSITGAFAIRQFNWKLCFCPGSAGWSSPRPGRDAVTGLPEMQLFDLSTDIGETKNLVAENPVIVERLTKLMDRYVTEGRSTPGAPQKNAVAVNFKSGLHPAVPEPKGKAQKGREKKAN